jgi:altronate dehydratase large subunit
MTAAGAQLNLFTTGPGNTFVSLLAPSIKISANPDAVARLPHHIDFDAHRVFLGRQSMEDAAQKLLNMSIDVASGMLTCGEILNEGDEVISRLGPAL